MATNIKEQDPILYLVMRNDLPSLNPGKLAAQSAHCANAFVGDVAARSGGARKLYMDWARQTKQCFGTTIVLAADGEAIPNLVKLAKKEGIVAGEVFDPTYPCEVPREIAEVMMNQAVDLSDREIYFCIASGRGLMTRRELVGAYLFGDKNMRELRLMLASLSLYP